MAPFAGGGEGSTGNTVHLLPLIHLAKRRAHSIHNKWITQARIAGAAGADQERLRRSRRRIASKNAIMWCLHSSGHPLASGEPIAARSNASTTPWPESGGERQ